MAIPNQKNYPIISFVITMTILIAVALLDRVEAQSPVGAPETVDPCMAALFNMSDCLSYVASGSNDTKPDKACCPELAGLVDSNPICLCQLLGNLDKLGISIDVKRALQLPTVCKVATPPVSTCAAIGIPVAAPTTSPPTPTPTELERRAFVVATISLAFALQGGAEAQSPVGMPESPVGAPETVDPCMAALFNMSDCLSYVASGSNDTKPDKACCPELAGLVDSNPICLCKLLGNPDKLGISIDVKRALQLPTVCKVSTPPVSTCAAIGIPVGAPSSSSSPDSIASPPASTPTGDITTGGAAISPSIGASNEGSSSSSAAITSLQCFVALAFMIFLNFF